MTCKAPVVVLVAIVVPVIDNEVIDAALIIPLTFRFPPIPTPPETISAPVDVELDPIVLITFTMPGINSLEYWSYTRNDVITRFSVPDTATAQNIPSSGDQQIPFH